MRSRVFDRDVTWSLTMSIDDKKKTLVKWLHAIGIHYVTLFSFRHGLCTFDFLDEHKTSFAGLCLGSVNQAITFPCPHDNSVEWNPYIAIDDEQAINFIANFLDAKAWHFEDGHVFFCLCSRTAIDLTGFSWETLAVSCDLNFPEEA